LRRFLEHRPILARRPSLRERVSKWARRHRAVVMMGLLLLVLAVAGLTTSTILIWNEKQKVTNALKAVQAKEGETNEALKNLQAKEEQRILAYALMKDRFAKAYAAITEPLIRIRDKSKDYWP